MKVLLISHGWSGGGAEEVCRNWATVLVRLGYLVDVVLLDQSPPAKGRPDGVNFLESPRSGLVARIRSVRELIGRSNYEAAIALQTYPNLVALLARMTGKARLVLSEHNVPSILLRNEGTPRRVQLFLAKWLYRRATAVVAVSHAVATDLQVNFGVDPSRLAVIKNAVLTGDRPYPSTPIPSTVHLLVPARFAPQKRPAKAVAIADSLRARGWTVTLTWVGDNPLGLPNFGESESAGMTRKHWADDWYVDLPRNTVVLLPSYVEGFGNVLVQAAAHGVPVVAGSSALGTGDAIVEGLTGSLAVSDLDSSFSDAVERAARLQPMGLGQPTPGWMEPYTLEGTQLRLGRLLDQIRAGEIS